MGLSPSVVLRPGSGFETASEETETMRVLRTTRVWAVAGVTLFIARTAMAAAPAAGPLRVGAANSRYFTDGSGKVVYLTGITITSSGFGAGS